VDFPIGGPNHVFTRNLTPDATTGLKLSEDEFVTALRTGRDFKDATGATALIVMPWQQLRWLTNQDLRDIYHYLRHIPAVDNAVQSDVKPTVPPSEAPFFNNGNAVDVPSFADGAVTRPLPAAFDPALGKPTAAAGELFDTNNVLRGLAISPLNDDATVATLSASEQALYGRGSYIVNGPALCNECHTPGGRNQDGTVKVATFLTGGQAFAVPGPLQPILKQVRTMSGNLTGTSHGFTKPFSVFLNTLLSGTSYTRTPPHGLGFPMPFDVFRNMTNSDKQAVYTYITTIQQNALVSAADTVHQAPARYCTVATVATDCAAGETCATVNIQGTDTGECIGATCTLDSDCGACQTCVGGPKACAAEDPNSSCVTTSF
jgi:hypothetical protein